MSVPYRADQVGSFLRPAELLEARRAGANAERLREIEDRHIRALTGELAGNGAPDSASSAGNYRS